ncbi:MAG: insulinase family protein [Bacteroidota bacterium]|nr:insulinase family protein [Bacteroidota bacterium]
MNIKNRNFNPESKNWKLNLPAFEMFQTANGIEVYTMESSKPGLVYIELVFKNGRTTETKKLAARVTANQILEGNEKLNANDIADQFDYCGAHYSIHADLDYTNVSVSCLQKHFKSLISFVVDIILNASFKAENLEKSKKSYVSQLSHQLTEPDFVSYREFTEHVYGKDHPYGYNSSKEFFENLTSDDLIAYHHANYLANNLKVFYCGECWSGMDLFFEEMFTSIPNRELLPKQPFIHTNPIVLQKHIPMDHCMQTSLKFGKKMFAKTHPDFFSCYIVNAILGDFFGSRLMKNIREEKGFTYDIHSTLDAQVYDGCFYIGAELSPEFLEKTIYEIKKELKILREHEILKAELDMVKNYLHGHILRLLDGSFQSILFLKILLSEYGSTDKLPQLLSTIRDITAHQICEMAGQYLKEDQMSIITAGAKL